MLGSNLSALAMLNGMSWHQGVPALFDRVFVTGYRGHPLHAGVD